MASGGRGGKPLVADRRYPRGGSSQPPKKPAPAKKAPRRTARPRRRHGLVVSAVLFLWRMVWAVLWRVGAVAVLGVGAVVLYFYAQLPPLTDLLDGRARGSVTMLDRGGQVFAWRGETFGGQITADTVSPYLHDAVVATEDKRFYWHLGISPRGIASAVRINLAEGRGPFEGNGGSTITQQVAKLLCLGVTFDPTQWKSKPTTKRTAAAAACGARSRKCPSPWRWS
jgi:penicillin-binding protein 1A